MEQPSVGSEVRIWWLGQSGYLVRWANRTILIDPYLSDSLTRKYASTDKPHVRMSELVITPDDLPRIDIVTSSHNHTDHLDAETLLPILKRNPEIQFIIPEANREFVAQRLGTPLEWPIGLDAGGKVEVLGVEFHGIAAAHNTIERTPAGHHLYLGYVMKIGPWTIYHSGDTLHYPGMELPIQELGPVDVALLPINGNKPERRVAGNLDGHEAARLAHAIGARLAVPCHYDMFEFNTADPAELFIPECQHIRQPYHILRGGESLVLHA
jgi:L-ascorbate metabolism protein UlaG (beta-lactamase superfamily)